MMLLVIILIAWTEPQLPHGTSCDQIKSLVAEHGKIKAVIWAREHGYTWAQIAEARKCLK